MMKLFISNDKQKTAEVTPGGLLVMIKDEECLFLQDHPLGINLFAIGNEGVEVHACG